MPCYCRPLPLVMLLVMWMVAGVCTRPARGGERLSPAEGESAAVTLRPGHSRIILSVDPSPELSDSAGLLQHYLERVLGSAPPIREGEAGRSGDMVISLDPAAGNLGRDGFRLWTEGGRLHLTAARPRGARNAVYTFLETYADCRKYSIEVEVVPRLQEILLPALDETQVPPLSFRLQDFKDPAYNAWHKLDSLEDWGLFVHTFHELVPPERYFQDHPEYYSENRGERVRDGQLCLTNPEVLRLVVDQLRRRMAANPAARYWSVSQNDTYLPCDCPECRAVNDEEGSPSGSILRFVNSVAAQFPDRVISTLAYQYSRRAPRLTRPAANVNIMLCSIESDRSRPMLVGRDSFVDDLEAWGALTDNIFLWDYVIQFRNLLAPFPNLHVLQPNLQFFVENGAQAVFEQGLALMHGEFAELRAYLIAKLLWDPYLDVKEVMTDFLEGYYGEAGSHLRRYIAEMQAALERSGEGLSCFGYPFPSEDGYLSAAMLARYGDIFDGAEAAVAGRPELLVRVQTARLPVQYTLLEQAKLLGDAPRGCFTRDEAGALAEKPGFAALLDTFVARCGRGGIDKLWEHGIPPQEYYRTTREFVAGSTRPHRARGAALTLGQAASPRYQGGQAAVLVDGMVGWNDYPMHWLGFEGTDMDAALDLGSVQPVSRIETAFLQDRLAWIFRPESITFQLSRDGVEFEDVAVVPASLDPRSEGARRVPVAVEFAPRPARFVRVRAVNMKKCPPWHKGAGGKAWVFCDEIQVF